MAKKVTMPKFGLTMVEGVITEWKKKEGDRVEKGEIIYVIETEKATFEIESPESGILAKIIAKVGETIPIGGLVAYIVEPGEKLSELPMEETIPETKRGVAENLPREEIATLPTPDMEKIEIAKKIKASPLARDIAKKHNIDLSMVKGTGPGGRITKEDVLKATEEKKPPVVPAPSEKEVIVPLTTMRKTIARRMSQSFQTAPHFWSIVEVDATEMKKARNLLLPSIENKTGIKLTYTDLLIKLVSRALIEFPYMNAAWTDGGIKLFKEINIGIAVDVPNGLIVPVLRQTTEKSLTEIVITRSDLVNRGRESKLTLDEMTGSTFTLSNVGSLNIVCGLSIINPPESCILTVGAMVDRPVVVGGEIVIRPIMTLSVGCDHRVLDGAYAAEFMSRLKGFIEQPLLILG